VTDSEIEAFTLTLLRLGEVFREELSAERIRAYYDALRDLPLADVVASMQVAVRDEEFFPRPATLRKLAPARRAIAVQRGLTTFAEAIRAATTPMAKHVFALIQARLSGRMNREQYAAALYDLEAGANSGAHRAEGGNDRA